MKLNLVKEEAKEISIEFDTSDFTIPDLIADELLEDSNVEFAGVSKDHPETGKPVLVIRAKKNPKASLMDAIERLDKNLGSLKVSTKRSK
jgi:DNA-directed RNA polymerase subunit L